MKHFQVIEIGQRCYFQSNTCRFSPSFAYLSVCPLIHSFSPLSLSLPLCLEIYSKENVIALLPVTFSANESWILTSKKCSFTVTHHLIFTTQKIDPSILSNEQSASNNLMTKAKLVYKNSINWIKWNCAPSKRATIWLFEWHNWNSMNLMDLDFLCTHSPWHFHFLIPDVACSLFTSIAIQSKCVHTKTHLTGGKNRTDKLFM